MTAFSLIAVSVTGFLILWALVTHVADRNLQVVYFLWPVKVLSVWSVSNFVWQPSMDVEEAGSGGYDSQRYVDLVELLSSGVEEATLSLNHPGIIMLYDWLSWIPLDVSWLAVNLNLFLSLLTSCLIILMAYKMFNNRTKFHWTIGFVILVPELIWFDALLSKESISAFLLVLFVASSSTFCTPIRVLKYQVAWMALTISILGMGLIRPRLLLIAGAILLIYSVASLRRGVDVRSLIFSVLGSFLSFSAWIAFDALWKTKNLNLALESGLTDTQEETPSGFSNGFNLYEIVPNPYVMIEAATTVSPVATSHGLIAQALGYAFAPFPSPDLSISNLIGGDWFAWNTFFSLVSSIVVLVLLIPTLMALYLLVRTKNPNRLQLLVAITVISFFAMLALGTDIIHERYRAIVLPLIYLLAWSGTVGMLLRKISEKSSGSPSPNHDRSV